tara:strand:+ start:114 stop:1271 length:1158 start_codon:yes stop_codon:yes gene_type:complete
MQVLMLLDNPFVSDVRVDKEAASLSKYGASVTVACSMENDLPYKEIRNGYTIIRLIEDGYNAPLRKSYKEYISRTADKIEQLEFNILHCHDFYMLSIGNELKKRNPSIYLIYDAHEYLKGWPFYKTSKGINKFKGRLVWNQLVRKEKNEIKKADKVITITSAIAERIRENSALLISPMVIGNYPMKTDLEVSNGYFHEKYKLPKDELVLIHSGTIYHTDFQLKTLFDIVTSITNLILVFVGDRPRFFDIKQIVGKDAELSKKIYFHDYPKTQNETVNLLGAADFGLLHVNDSWEAHKIGFSNRFAEYIMAELPVVATPQEFTFKLNNELECCAFYHENNSVELKNAIQKITANKMNFKKNAMAAREKLDWKLESQKLIDLYKSLS